MKRKKKHFWEPTIKIKHSGNALFDFANDPKTYVMNGRTFTLLENYKARINKAIEYTKQFTNGKTSSIDEWENVELVLETIIDILKGEDKDGED